MSVNDVPNKTHIQLHSPLPNHQIEETKREIYIEEEEKENERKDRKKRKNGEEDLEINY